MLLLEKEIWKDIPNYEGLYKISSLGNIKSFQKRHKQILILKPKFDKDGYLLINLYKNKLCKTYKIHRLVAKIFIKNHYNKPQVNHKDGIKSNNFIDNLEWVTPSENLQHAWDNKLNKGITGKRLTEEHKEKISKNNAKGNSKVIENYNPLTNNTILRFNSIIEACHFYKIKTITSCLRGDQKRSGGYYWRYV